MPARPVDLEAALGPGRTIAGYEPLALVGRGASSRVYRARERSSGRLVALKLMHAGADAVAARSGEWEVARALRHPNIIEVLAAGDVQGARWLALEWVPGYDLSRYVEDRWRLPDVLAVETVQRIAAALACAHAQGVTHRDVKPSNVRIHLARRIVKLGDFGVASVEGGTATATGEFKGTPAYMAPEVLLGQGAGAPADLYALGVVLYELLTGRRPHQADSLGQLLALITRERPGPLAERRRDLPAALVALVDRLLEREPRDRPGGAGTVAEELATIGQEMRAARANA